MIKVLLFLIFSDDTMYQNYFNKQVQYFEIASQKLKEKSIDIQVIPMIYLYHNDSAGNFNKINKDISYQIQKNSSANLAVFYVSAHGRMTNDTRTNKKDKYSIILDNTGSNETSNYLISDLYDSILQFNKKCPTALFMNSCESPNFNPTIQINLTSNLWFQNTNLQTFANYKISKSDLISMYEKSKVKNFNYNKEFYDNDTNNSVTQEKVANVKFLKAKRKEKNLSLVYSFDQKPFSIDTNYKEIELGANIIFKELFENLNSTLKEFNETSKNALQKHMSDNFLLYNYKIYLPELQVIEKDEKKASNIYYYKKILK